MSRQARIAVLERLLAAFNAHDLDQIMRMFTDDCVLDMPRGPDPWGSRAVGKDDVRSALATRFSGIPDVHYGDSQHFIDGDTAITQWTLSGTRLDGERVEVRGCDFFTFRGDLVAKKDSFWKIRI